MYDVNDLHNNAMDHAEKAKELMLHNDYDTAIMEYKIALIYERYAANSAPISLSKFVLLRSAASLAFLCGEYISSLSLIWKGLRKNPYKDIVNELKDLKIIVELSHFLIDNYSACNSVSHVFYKQLDNEINFIILTKNRECDIPMLREFDDFEIEAGNLFPDLKIYFSHRMDIEKNFPKNATLLYKRDA